MILLAMKYCRKTTCRCNGITAMSVRFAQQKMEDILGSHSAVYEAITTGT